MSEPVETMTGLVEFLSARARMRHSLRNQTRCLYAELSYNHALLRSWKGMDPSDESEDEGEPVPGSGDKGLELFLDQMRTQAFQWWMQSDRNLDRLGWIVPDRGRKMRFWDHLARVYGRMDILSRRLKMGQALEDRGVQTVRVLPELHFARLESDLRHILHHLRVWQESGFLRRAWCRTFRRPLVHRRHRH